MILHIIKDNRDTAWNSWDGYDETDRFCGTCDTLRNWRAIFKVRLHRGPHPDASKLSRSVQDHVEVPGVSIYWAEVAN